MTPTRLGEMRRGAGREVDGTVMVITLGTGIMGFEVARCAGS